MKLGQKLIHKNYGDCTVISIISKEEKFRGGVLLKLSKESLEKLNNDRDNFYAKSPKLNLIYLFEDDFNYLKIKNE